MDNNLTVLTNEHLTVLMNLPAEHNDRLARAKDYYEKTISPLLELSVSELDDEQDKVLNDFCAAINTTVKDMTSKRAPFFRTVDEYRSLFTGTEKQVAMLGDNAKKKRDERTTYLQNKIREQERVAAEELRMKSLMIDYRQQAQYGLQEFANTQLAKLKESILKAFNECTLSNVDVIEARLNTLLNEKTIQFSWPANPRLSAFMELPEETTRIIYYEEVEKVDTNPFFEVRKEFLESYLSKMPNKREELVREEQASVAEKERIEKQRAEFKKAEQERINKEIEESNAAALTRSTIAAETEKGNQIFDAIPAASETNLPKGTKEDAELRITSIEGYTKIIGLWLRHEAPNVPLEDLPKKAISVMVTFAKKRYLTTGEKIECPGIEYIDKATSRVVKK
jgi:hypothetical protein